MLHYCRNIWEYF